MSSFLTLLAYGAIRAVINAINDDDNDNIENDDIELD
jgi:hypothetical protein